MKQITEALAPAKQQITQTEETDQIKGHVSMSRALAMSAHNLTINEARVMMLACRSLDSTKTPRFYDPSSGYVKVKITIEEFAKIADIEKKNGKFPGAVYDGLKAGCNRIFERRASWREGKKQIKLAWVWKATYHDEEGWAEICFSPDITPHLLDLKNRFITYRLELVKGLRSIYSANLLRLLMTQKNTKKLVITLEKFREVMEIPESYRFADINRYAIQVAIKELEKRSGLLIQCQLIKKGRSVHSLQFNFIDAPKS